MSDDLIPATYRKYAYALYAVGSVVITYLVAKRIIGADEAALWAGVGTVFGLTAAAHTGTRSAPTVEPTIGDAPECAPVDPTPFPMPDDYVPVDPLDPAEPGERL